MKNFLSDTSWLVPAVAVAALLTGCTTRPELDSVAPSMWCSEGGEQTLTIAGRGLNASVSGIMTEQPAVDLPSVRFDPMGGLGEDDEGDRGQPLLVPPERIRWVDAQTLEVLFDDEVHLSAGTWAVSVTTPDGRKAELAPALSVAGTPLVTTFSPPSVCHEIGAVDLTVEGTGFVIAADGSLPTITVGDQSATALTASDCVPVVGPAGGEVCRTLTTSVDATLLPIGGVGVTVSNPEPAACGDADPASLTVAPPPEIDAVDLDAVCAQSGALTIRGSGFVEGMSVEIEGATVSDVVLLDEETLQATFADGTVGPADVSITEPTGCSDSLPDAVSLADSPVVFSVDPPVVYAWAKTWVRAFAADLYGDVTDVWIEPADGGAAQSVEWTWDPSDPGAVSILVPGGLSTGEWRIGLVEDDACEAEAAGTFEVRSWRSVAVGEVEPSIVWSLNRTAIEVRTEAPIPAGEFGFEETPQLYLVGPDQESEATRLPAVVWRSSELVSAVVPDSMEVGSYDLLVVNPDGRIGRLANGLSVTDVEPPSVFSVTPGSLSKTSDETLTITGQAFDEPIVQLECLQSDQEVGAELTVESWSDDQISAVLPANTLSRAVCVVVVTNADGAVARWSAVSVRNPSENLFPWQDGPDLSAARRAPSAVVGRTSPVSRYAYAMGGDNGLSRNAMDSIEVSVVGVYGRLDGWTPVADPLPEPRTLAAAVPIGRFVYLLGGYDGTTALASVRRAMILDPLDVPWFDELSLARSHSEGLTPGTWTYRISALYDENDAANPGGEGLPSEIVSVTLPDVGDLLVPTVRWTAVDGAVAYRVYRSPAAESGPGSEEWLTDVTDGALEYTDVGGTTDGALVPLGDGSLGMWAELPPMSEARESLCVAAAPDPDPDPERVWIYAAGGRDEAGTKLRSIEALDIVIESDKVQTVGSWVDAGVKLSEPRYRCGGYVVDSSRHSVVDEGEVWVYFVGGETRGGKTSAAVDAGRVVGKGALDDWQVVDTLSPARSGFAAASASNYLYLFGGQQGRPHKSGASAELESGTLPDLVNWNSQGLSMSESRLLPGSAQESAMIVVIGGRTNDDGATVTTEVTHY